MKVVTAVVNNPEFIEIQYYTLKKHFKGKYEFIVFNDAKDFPDFTNDGDVTIKNKIENICEELNIQCINIPNQHHIYSTFASNRTADSMNFILEYQKQYPDKYLLLDSDMFLIGDFEIDKYNNYSCAVVLQQRPNINYIWNGLYYFNICKLRNLDMMNWNMVAGCDTGAMMYKWLHTQLQNKDVPDALSIRNSDTQYIIDDIYFIKHLWSGTWNESEIPDQIRDNHSLLDFLKTDQRNQNEKFYCEIYDNVFLHYRAGGNYNKEGLEFHKLQTEKLKAVLLNSE